MSDKRMTLLAICELPGWQPSQPVSSSTARTLNDLRAEGWIRERLDGWEATPKAVQAYPQFAEQMDIADPEVTMRIRVPQTSPEKPDEALVLHLDLAGLFCPHCEAFHRLMASDREKIYRCSNCGRSVLHTHFFA